ALVTLLYYLTYGVILTLIPDWSGHIGMENKGLFFLAYTVASLAIRFLAGKFSDTHGRLYVSKIGLVLLIVSMIILGYGSTSLWLLCGADRKSTRLNSSHVKISYAVFCFKKIQEKVTHRD